MSRYLGNTFEPMGFSGGCQHASLQRKVSQIIVHEADRPEVVNFFNADRLASKERWMECVLCTSTCTPVLVPCRDSSPAAIGKISLQEYGHPQLALRYFERAIE